MSLSRLAMRICAARALRNATLAASRVYDSKIDPVDFTDRSERDPLVIVSTDEDITTPFARDIHSPPRRCQLVIEFSIATKVATEDLNANELVVPDTDEGLELTLDIMEHQIIRALTNEISDWSRVFMKLAPKLHEYISRRGAISEDGTRFAARQILLDTEVIDTPQIGAPIDATSYWADVLFVMETDSETEPVAKLLRAQIEGSTVPFYQRDANDLGITENEARSIGIWPYISPTEQPATIDEVDVQAEPEPDILVTEREAQLYLDGIWSTKPSLKGTGSLSATGIVE